MKHRSNTTVPDVMPPLPTRWYVAIARRSFPAVVGRRLSRWMNWGSASGLLENQRKTGAGSRLLMDSPHQLACQNIHDRQPQGLRLAPIQAGRQSDSVVRHSQRDTIVVFTMQRNQNFARARIRESILQTIRHQFVENEAA